ncbi:hypothetical protein [Streptomyces clavifer]|uniref:hypothetical protein n=1 Tax=Streptomyces clavifer TaxID=68188 RepID=UPI0033F82FD1
MSTVPDYEANYTEEQKQLAEHLIGLEKSALDKWLNGDVSGYRELWSRRSFTYFDGANLERVEDHETIDAFLDELDGSFMQTSTTSAARVCSSVTTRHC